MHVVRPCAERRQEEVDSSVGASQISSFRAGNRPPFSVLLLGRDGQQRIGLVYREVEWLREEKKPVEVPDRAPVHLGLDGNARVGHAIPEEQYQVIFDYWSQNGYRPIWVDGYDLNGAPFLNAIFDRSPANWIAFHGRDITDVAADHHLDADEYQNLSDELVGMGFLPAVVTGYQNGSVPNFGGIWAR